MNKKRVTNGNVLLNIKNSKDTMKRKKFLKKHPYSLLPKIEDRLPIKQRTTLALDFLSANMDSESQ